MDKTKLQTQLDRRADQIWNELCELRPRLVRFNPPKIKINGRLWRTAGRCFQETRKVDVGYKFFEHSREYGIIMLATILPHELIHQADFDLYGESEKNCGHGKNWRKLMLEYGLPDNPFHSMEITRK
jgi:predicted SprT family Zn-dependent metalloprotease